MPAARRESERSSPSRSQSASSVGRAPIIRFIGKGGYARPAYVADSGRPPRERTLVQTQRLARVGWVLLTSFGGASRNG